MPDKTVYKCGLADHGGDEDPGIGIGYCDESDIWERFESGEWTPWCWDSETGVEWVQTPDDDLLVLTPVPEGSVPGNAVVGDIDRVAAGASDDD